MELRKTVFEALGGVAAVLLFSKTLYNTVFQVSKLKIAQSKLRNENNVECFEHFFLTECATQTAPFTYFIVTRVMC